MSPPVLGLICLVRFCSVVWMLDPLESKAAGTDLQTETSQKVGFWIESFIYLFILMH